MDKALAGSGVDLTHNEVGRGQMIVGLVMIVTTGVPPTLFARI
jgi:hypothetical protein